MKRLFWNVFRRDTIIRAINRREEYGFIQIYNSCFYSVFHFAYRQLDESNGVEEIVERAFSMLWNSKLKWESASEFRRDLFGVTRSLCSARLLIGKKFKSQYQKQSFFHEYIKSLVFGSLKETLDCIPEHYHVVFLFRFVWRKEISVIENTLGIPRDRVIEVQSKIQSILHEKYSRRAKFD